MGLTQNVWKINLQETRIQHNSKFTHNINQIEKFFAPGFCVFLHPSQDHVVHQVLLETYFRATLWLMLHLVLDLGKHAAQALIELAGNDLDIPQHLPVIPSSRPEFGDFQISASLQWAKPLGKQPRELAGLIQAKMMLHPAIEKAEIAGPGYVNLTLKTNWLESQVQALREDVNRGVHTDFSGQSVVVDFSSPNIAKPMHVGHIRSTIIGDAIARILKAVGYHVVTDNHLGDWGTQFGKLLVAYKRFRNPTLYEQKPLDELVRLYQLFISEEKKEAQALGYLHRPEQEDEEATEPEAVSSVPNKVTPLLAAARAELVKLQNGDAENIALWKNFISVSLKSFEKSYQRLGVHFDIFLGESFYHPYLAPVVKRLLDQGIAEYSQGAVICPIEGEATPLLIRKADGAFLYGTTDLATLEYRIATFNPSRIFYVVGAPQQLHFRQVFAVAKKMNIACSLEHIAFGSIRFRDPETGAFATGSTRKGNVPLLDEMLDEAVSRAETVVTQKNPALPLAEIEEIARKIGIGAIKYNNLARDRNADINFDLDQALALEGNTAPYIQYAYARLRSIKRKAQEEKLFPESIAIHLELPAERSLAKRLLEYSLVIDQVAHSIRLQALTEYLYELATSVSQFYHEVPVLKAEPQQRASRLFLLDEVAKTLQHGLLLLGIESPERM